jgi:hypothetical protein
MSNYSIDTDVIIDIFQSGSRGLATGFDSIYTSVAHPGSNKKIEGWRWDKRVWPDKRELDAIEYVPSIWDPTSSFVGNSYWQSGIGDNKDLLLFEIIESTLDNENKWIPKINHGYFYDNKLEWYLLSDDYLSQHFYNNQLFSGVQYVDLTHKLKPSIPLNVKRYRWDRQNQEYIIDLDFRKRVYFTGIVTNGVEADTENDDGNVSYENISSTNPEFIVDYDYSNTPRVYLNDDYSETIATSGDFKNYEFIGTGDGYNNKFYTRYSPVDPSGQFELVSYVGSGTYVTWNQIDNLLDFTDGGSYEYKLDNNLGIVSLGNYDETTGSGLIPTVGMKLAARYTKGITIEYEPEWSRNYIFARDVDIDPIKNAFEAGFLTLGLQKEVPTSVVLTSDLPTGSNYQANLSGLVGNLIATVKSANNNLIPNQNVVFELISPFVGSLSSSNSITNTNGQAKVVYSPPSSINDIGIASDDFLYSGTETIINFPGLPDLNTESGILLYEIHREDEFYGFPASGEDAYYIGYLNEDGLTVNPDGTDALGQDGIDFEKSYRNQFDLSLLTTIDDTDSSTLSIGKRVLSYANNPNEIHPHSGIQKNPVFAPVFPKRYSNIGTASSPIQELVYDGFLTGFADEVKAYFAVAETTINARAYITNPNTNRRIYSNTISIDINIPDESDGIIIADEVSDIPSGAFREVKDLDNYSDDWIINLTSGILYDTYLENRLASGEQGYKQLDVTNNTTALYHLNGSFEDSGPYGLDASTTSVQWGEADPIYATPSFVEKAKYWDRALLINDAGDFAYTNGLSNHFSFNSGTLEFSYRAPYADYVIGSGASPEYFCAYIGQDENVQNNGIVVYAQKLGGIPHLSTLYLASGEVPPHASSDEWIYPISDTDLVDGYWHQIKVTWEYEPALVEDNPHSGTLSIHTYIDNVQKMGVDNLAFFSKPGEVIESGYNYIAGISDNAAIPGYYDEIRITSGELITAPTFQPWYNVRYEDYTSWFRRVRPLDSKILGLNTYLFSGEIPATLPLGFRLKDSSTDVASIIGHRTFLDVNDSLPSSSYTMSGLDIFEEYY